jgi:hypothetical protein
MKERLQVAKKIMRAITASEDIAPVIDRGADVDNEIKNLTFEDKGIKTKLIEVLSEEIADDETSIRVEAERSAAIISAAEKTTIRVGADKYTELRESVKKGMLPFVDMKQTLTVPPAEVEKAAEALKAAGITVTVTESLTVKAADVRKMKQSESASAEHLAAENALEACLDTDTSYRVKYEKAKGAGE